MFKTIENDLISVTVSTLGATLVKFIDKKTNKDLVLGFDNEEEYIANNGTNIGATAGRNANRIGGAKFNLNGVEYKLSENDHGNQLHGGGINGFAFKTWMVDSIEQNEIVFSYDSKDGEEGFPGNLHAAVSYKLFDSSLVITFSGTSDKDTIFNLTNHSYFNLGDKDIMNHSLQVLTDKYSPTDEVALTLDKVVDVKDTPYDFSKPTLLKDNLSKLEAGIDNNYVWENMDDKKMAELAYDNLQLNVYTDLPDMHVYTAYYLNDEIGKYGKEYKPYSGICLECQFYPNGINYKDYIKPILKANETVEHYIKFEVEHI